MCALRGVLQTAVRQGQAHMGERQSPMPPSVLCARTHSKGRNMSDHKALKVPPTTLKQAKGENHHGNKDSQQ